MNFITEEDVKAIICRFKLICWERKKILRLNNLEFKDPVDYRLFFSPNCSYNKYLEKNINLNNAIAISNILSCTGLTPLIELPINNPINMAKEKIPKDTENDYILLYDGIKYKNIGEIIKRYRKEHKLTQYEISLLINTSTANICVLENNDINVSLYTLSKIQNILNIDLGIRYIPKSLKINTNAIIHKLATEYYYRLCELDLNATSFAKICGISQSTLSKFRNGHNLRLSTAIIISEYLAVIEKKYDINNKKLIDIHL